MTLRFAETSLNLRDVPRLEREQPRLVFDLTSLIGGEGSQGGSFSWTARAFSSGDTTAAPTPTDDPGLRREVELKLAAPPRRPGPPRASVGRWRPGLVTLGAAAEALHAATGLEVVSDSFTRARLDPALLAGKRQVVEVLDLLATETAGRWEKEGPFIRIRSRRHYHDRPMEVPERVLAPWRERVTRAQAAAIEDLAELTVSLTDPQLKGMEDYWGWYLRDADVPLPHTGGVYSNRYHLRVWGSLLPAQKQTLLGRGSILVREMNGLQRQAFAAALTAPEDRLLPGLPLTRMPTPEDIAGGALSLLTREMPEQVGFAGAAEPLDTGRTLRFYMLLYHLPGEERISRSGQIGVSLPASKSQ